MIFVAASNEPTIFLMLSDKDVKTMREGRTVFVDQRATKGATFEKVVLSLSKTDQDSMDMLRRAGHDVSKMPFASHERKDVEGQCAGCKGLMSETLLFETKCMICWATEAKNLRRESN